MSACARWHGQPAVRGVPGRHSPRPGRPLIYIPRSPTLSGRSPMPSELRRASTAWRDWARLPHSPGLMGLADAHRAPPSGSSRSPRGDASPWGRSARRIGRGRAPWNWRSGERWTSAEVAWGCHSPMEFGNSRWSRAPKPALPGHVGVCVRCEGREAGWRCAAVMVVGDLRFREVGLGCVRAYRFAWAGSFSGLVMAMQGGSGLRARCGRRPRSRLARPRPPGGGERDDRGGEVVLVHFGPCDAVADRPSAAASVKPRHRGRVPRLLAGTEAPLQLSCVVS